MSRREGVRVQYFGCMVKLAASVLLLSGAALVSAQAAGRAAVSLAVVDENGQPVSGAEITLEEPGSAPRQCWTDYAGHCQFAAAPGTPYALRAQKAGYYQTTEKAIDPGLHSVHVELVHEQIVSEKVNVTASTPGLDTQQVSDTVTMNTPEIVNIPYQTSRDIRYLLPYFPGIVQDSTEQVHVAGAETWETEDLLDGFDIRSPVNGVLSMRVSADAVRSIDAETTRYPVEFGRGTGGVVAFYTGMGDNKFRFNGTNFIPSFRDLNGIRFDKFVPRFTFSGPIKRDKAWFYDGLELEYDNIYIPELPANANTDQLARGSNLIKVQANLSPANILTGGLLFNDYHSPYDGISSLTPQQSTTNRNTIAWLPYLREQWTLRGGALLDAGVAVATFRDGYEPHGSAPFQFTPELSKGSYFENLTGRSQRVEGTAALYLPARHWMGVHDVKMGLDVDRVAYDQRVARTSVSYLREDGTLSRQSLFPQTAPFTLHNVEPGAYVQDRWQRKSGRLAGLLLEPGLRLDWDEIIRRPLLQPRVAAVYAPPGSKGATKISAGIGLYGEHTQLEYLTRALAGMRQDVFYAPDGVTPTGPAQTTNFSYDASTLRVPRAVNWSVGLQQKLPGGILAGFNVMGKQTSRMFTYVNQSGAAALAGRYALTNGRKDTYHSVEVDAKRVFAGGSTLFASYTRSSARTNAALEFKPTPSILGPQQSGPLPWDAPNRLVSWGWLPAPLPRIRKSWELVYDLSMQSGYPYTAMNANHEIVGAPGAQRFPTFIDFSPGLEWRFHFRGAYFGLRGVMENALDRNNPAVVDSVVESPEFGHFSEFQGRAFTARIRLIGQR